LNYKKIFTAPLINLIFNAAKHWWELPDGADSWGMRLMQSAGAGSEGKGLAESRGGVG